LTASEFENEWRPDFSKDQQVVYDDKVVTIVDINYEDNTYTVDSIDALQKEKKRTKKDKGILQHEIQKLKDELEILEIERDAVPLAEIQTIRTLELIKDINSKSQETLSKSKELKAIAQHLKQIRKTISSGSVVSDLAEEQLTKLVDMNYEVGTYVVYNYDICQILLVDHVEISYVLDCGDTVTDVDLDKWCVVEEKDGSHTIWRIMGHTAKRFKLFNPKWENNPDNNPNWTNSKHKKKREIELTSKNVIEQVGVGAFLTDKVGNEDDGADNGTDVIEFSPGDTVVVGSGYVGTIMEKVPGKVLENDMYRIRIDSHPPIPWYRPTVVPATAVVGTVGLYSVSEIDYPTTEQTEDSDEQVSVNDVVVHDGVEWVVIDIVDNVVHWERVEVADSDGSSAEEDDDDIALEWDVYLEENDRVMIVRTKEIAHVRLIDYEDEKIVLDNGKSYRQSELSKVEEDDKESEGEDVSDDEQSSGSDEDDDN